MIVTRTPARLPLGGGGTDLPSYYSQYGSFLVSAAIDKYTYLTVNKRFDDSIRVSYSRTEIVDKVEEIQHPLVREALKLLKLNRGIEIVSIADVPANTGMGTSSSFTVGLLNALHTFKQEHVSAQTLAEEACKIEIDILGEPIGKQDQYLGAFGGVTCLDIDREGKVTVSPLSLPDDTLELLESNILLFYTGIKRSASEVLRDQSDASRQNDERVNNALHTIKEIGKQIKVALESGNLRLFGELLDAHWETKKKLSDKVTVEQIDRWYEVGKRNGALGGKLMGAGGGGFLMFYCENEDKRRLRGAMAAEGLRQMRFHIDFEGSKVLVNI